MKKDLITIVFVLSLLVFFSCGRNLKEYEYLKEPHIRNIQKQKMIAVHVQGDPNAAGGDAFKVLFKTFYKLKSKVDNLEDSAPRARWPKSFNIPKNEWIGIYGLPIPENVNELPESDKKIDIEVKIEYWDYGDVAEILHIGSYSSEAKAIEKLIKYIKINGYKIIGEHEEEYLKGPGMFFKGDPDKYQTIIRYRIEKK